MPTVMPKKAEVARSWHLVDADGQVLGRLAARVATLLMGKHKPTYAPHVDVGDHVVVINAARVQLTGRKATGKTYRTHSGYIGGLKEVRADTMLRTHPERVVEWAVSGMLPKTKLGRAMGRKLRVYRAGDHLHAAQRPAALAPPARSPRSRKES
jgi:large subunit ribosomal protein L13